MSNSLIDREITQGVIPIGTPKAYKYDAALVEAAKASVQQGMNQLHTDGNSIISQANTILAAIRNQGGYPLKAATASAMTDTTKIYVYTGSETGYTFGHWYYHNGTAWTDGGVYNAMAFNTDPTLTVPGEAADAKVTGEKISGNANFLANEVGKNIVYSDICTANSSSWVNVDTNISLKKDVEYTLNVGFSPALTTAGYFRIMDSTRTTVIATIRPNGSNGKVTFTPTDNYDNCVLNMSLTSTSYPIQCFYVISTGLSETVYDLSKHALRQSGYNLAHYGGNANTAPVDLCIAFSTNEISETPNIPDVLLNYPTTIPMALCTITTTNVRGYQLLFALDRLFFRDIRHNDKVCTEVRNLWKEVATDASVIAKIKGLHAPYANYETLFSTVNGAYLRNTIRNEGMNCTPSNIYGTHESNIYVYNDKIYLVYAANKIDYAEDHTKYNIELTCTNLNGTVDFSKKVVAVGDTVCGYEVVGCQAPFILPKGDKLHIYCDVKISASVFKLVHTVYDITNDTFSTFEAVTYINKSGNSEVAENGEQYIDTGWFAYGGHDNCTALFFNQDNAGIGYTEDYTSFTFIVRADVSDMGAGGESCAKYISAFNKFIYAYRTGTSESYLTFKQYNITRSEWEAPLRIPDATARPKFVEYNGSVYLFNNAPYSREDITIWKYLTYSVDGNWTQMGMFEPISVARADRFCTYFDFCVYDGELYMVGICDNLTKVVVFKIDIQPVSKADVYAKIRELFTDV